MAVPVRVIVMVAVGWVGLIDGVRMVEVRVLVSNFWAIHLVAMGGEVVECGSAFCVEGW